MENLAHPLDNILRLYEEIILILMKCIHGDESICGCRDRALEKLNQIRTYRK